MDEIFAWIGTPGLIVIGVYFYYLITKKPSDKEDEDDLHNDNRIINSRVNFDMIMDQVDNFQPLADNKLPTGFTETSIQKQFYVHLKKTFKTVTREYGIEGVVGKKIDFDIASGKAGIELKMSKHLLRSKGYYSLKGQLTEYQTKKYNNNLVLIVFGSKDDKENTMMQEVNIFCKKNNIEFRYKIIREFKQDTV